MIKTLLLAALVAMAYCQEEVDQAEYYGPRMGSGPFCDSRCLPGGTWTFRRDWVDLETAIDNKYIFFVDGSGSYWDSGCGTLVNNFILSPNGDFDEEDFLECRPEIVYFFELNVDYKHDQGRLIQTFILQDAYVITPQSWTDFINDYFAIGSTVTQRTFPWTLLRSAPSLEGATYISQYNDDVYVEQTFIANYERNFCTFVGSVTPIQEIDVCNFSDDYDSDVDSDEPLFVSPQFCSWIVGDFSEHDVQIGCGDSDDDECDSIRVVDDPNNRRNGAKAEGLVNPMKVINEMLMSARMNSPVVEVVGEKRDQLKRGTYDYTDQAIPGFGTSFSDDWNQAVFYYTPYTSSITAPYCGFRDN